MGLAIIQGVVTLTCRHKKSIMKKIIVIVILLLPFFLIAQVKHEVKSDIRTFWRTDSYLNSAILFYEYIPQPSKGIELDVGYYSDIEQIPDTAGRGVFPRVYSDFKRQYTKIGITTKFYFSKKQNATGLFLGLYNAYQIETYREAGYEEEYLRVYKEKPEVFTLQSITLGGTIGYKWLVWKRLIVEGQIRFGPDILSSFRDKVYTGDGDGFIKLGYRFGKNRE